jgi:hypothetical protein
MIDIRQHGLGLGYMLRLVLFGSFLLVGYLYVTTVLTLGRSVSSHHFKLYYTLGRTGL